MGRYIVRRLLQFVPVFFGATFLVFMLMYVLPGDPALALAGDKTPSPSVIAAIKKQHHLNDPWFVQYGYFFSDLLKGDLGETPSGRPVTQLLKNAYPVTMKLGLTALVIETVFGLLLGAFAGLKRGGITDNSVLIATLLLISMPSFVLGALAQIVFGVKLGLFPVAGLSKGWPESYLLPAIVLASLNLAYVARLTRTSLVENLRADYIRTALSKGFRRSRIVGVHGMRNSLIPVVTLLGTDVGNLMAGAIVTERIFNLPGIGGQLYKSILLQEAGVVVGIVSALVIVYMVANLLVDILYAVLDPRIRYD